MFQAVPPPIIRSTKLYVQRQISSNQYCCLLLSWMRWSKVPYHPRQLYVQFCAPDDGRRNRLKHVEQIIEINRSRKHCILLVVLQIYYHGYRVFPGGKERPGRDADPSPFTSAVVKKGQSYTSTPPQVVRPVQSLSACTRVHFILDIYLRCTDI